MSAIVGNAKIEKRKIELDMKTLLQAVKLDVQATQEHEHVIPSTS